MTNDEKAAWMRSVGATECQWDYEGRITHLKLGPAPFEPELDDPGLTPEEMRERAEAERRRIRYASSGSVTRRE